MTYLEIVAQMKANRKRHAEALREQAVMDHTQATLMAFAINDPQKMPSLQKAYPFVEQLNYQVDQHVAKTNIEQPQRTQERAWQNDQAMLIQQAMKVKETRRRKRNQAK